MRIRLAAIVLAVLATLVLVASAIGTSGPRMGPPITTGPSVCRLDGYRVPCS
jgi:hypothetical protein